MKKFLHSLSLRQVILGISAIVSFLVFLVLYGIAGALSHKELSQQMARRWSADGDMAQISCFFSQDAEVSHDRIEEFRHSIDGALTEASIVQDSPNANARLWADAFSAGGRISVTSERTTIQADALGVGGDFFLFHPLRLLKGSYFSESDLNSDYVILDEDGAWQLFGSNDIAGMTVFIGGKPHIVAGVVHREKGRLEEAAGLDGTLVYVSYDTLQKYGTDYGINHYEIVMPNPVKKFAYNYVMEHIGVGEENREILENTSRYSLQKRLEVILDFGLRSMNGKAIIYPYWENIARGYEDIIALLTLFALIFLSYPVLLILIVLVILWRHKTWTARSVFLFLQDKTERGMDRLRVSRKQKREAARAKRRRKKEYKDKFDEEEEYDE